MVMRRMLTLTVLLLGCSAAAHADILATGAMFGGLTQNGVVCYLFNAGAGPVTVVSNQIIREPNISVPLVTDHCDVLAAGTTCVVAANIENNRAHACKFVVIPSKADVRGVMEIRSGFTVLQNSNLR